MKDTTGLSEVLMEGVGGVCLSPISEQVSWRSKSFVRPSVLEECALFKAFQGVLGGL